MCLYGDVGMEKTRTIWTSPGRVLIIRPPVEHTNAVRPEDRDRCEEAVVNDWDEMWTLQKYLREEGSQYDWVWVDNVQGVYDVCLDDIWEDTLRRSPKRGEYDTDKSEHGVNMSRIGRWFRHTVGPDLFNFGYTAHAETVMSPDQDEEGDAIEKLMPYVQGKGMATKIAGYTNIVGYMTKANIKGRGEVRVMRTESTSTYYAKDQFGALGGRVIEPTMPKVIDLINKTRGVKPATKAAKPAPKKTARRVVRR